MQHAISFPDSAKVFIYQADRLLTDDECRQLLSAAEQFSAAWQSHGQPVRARAELHNHCQLVFLVDESAAHLGGCSIDGNVHFVKEWGARLGVDFFNRMMLAFDTANGFMLLPYSGLQNALNEKQLDASSRLYDNTLNQYVSWRLSWRKPLAESWLAKSFQF